MMAKLFKNAFWFGVGVGLGVTLHRAFWQNRPLTQLLGPPVLRWWDRGKSDQDIIDALKASGLRIKQQLLNTHPTQKNYAVLNHLIGIERWGQRRLAVALGEPLVEEEYDGYRPPRGLSWNELQDQFAETRDQTITLAQLIRDRRAGSNLIPHNSYGQLTPAMWLTFLRAHAEGELLKMR